MKKIGLIGSITHDFITSDSGCKREGLGGILYQAAAFSGLGWECVLFTNLGQDLLPLVKNTTALWERLDTESCALVPGPGNRVHLHYPAGGERQEVLESVVPSLDPHPALHNLDSLDFLVFVINSGYDISLKNWRKIVAAADCPLWLDLHSLPLSKNLGSPRTYRSTPEWKDWAAEVDYVQANAAEMAAAGGWPGQVLSEAELDELGHTALEHGTRAVFVTHGQQGVRVITPHGSRNIATRDAEIVSDTTGCGDVFCAAVVSRLQESESPLQAAVYGVRLATEAVRVAGVQETFDLTRRLR